MKNLQKGFAIPLIIAVIALLVASGGFFVYEFGYKNHIRKIEIIEYENSFLKETSNWTVNFNEKYGFEIKYPTNIQNEPKVLVSNIFQPIESVYNCFDFFKVKEILEENNLIDPFLFFNDGTSQKLEINNRPFCLYNASNYEKNQSIYYYVTSRNQDSFIIIITKTNTECLEENKYQDVLAFKIIKTFKFID